METLWTPALSLVLMGLVAAVLMYAKDWVGNRRMEVKLERLDLAMQVGIKQRELLQQATDSQTVLISNIERMAQETKDLSVGTHEIVNAQRSQMREDMQAQKAEFERVIAALRNELHLAQQTLMPGAIVSGVVAAMQQVRSATGSPHEVGGETVTIPAITVPVMHEEPAPDPPKIIHP